MSEPNKPTEKKIDTGWKEEARKAKEAAEKPRRKPDPAEGAGGPEPVEGAGLDDHSPGPIPKPDFSFLVSSIAMQILMCLGHVPHPATGKPEIDLEQAKHGVDLLDMLEVKTKGNLTPDESKLLTATLYDLRVRYIALSQPRQRL